MKFACTCKNSCNKTCGSFTQGEIEDLSGTEEVNMSTQTYEELLGVMSDIKMLCQDILSILQIDGPEHCPDSDGDYDYPMLSSSRIED